jgi:hypothetical protein
MGELQYGVYDDECQGLTPKEINVFYDLNDDNEVQGSDEDSDQSDEGHDYDEDSDQSDEGHDYDEDSDQSDEGHDYDEESEAAMEIDEPESNDGPVLDLPFDMEVRSFFKKFST